MNVYGYIRASDLPEIESPQLQQHLIENYCQRGGQQVHAYYIDTSDSGRLPLHRREAGARLVRVIERGDHIILARLDRLADSFLDAAHILDCWVRRGVAVHVLDIRRCCLHPDKSESITVIDMLIAFAWYSRKMVGARVKASFSKMKKQGERFSRHAPYGFEWQRRGEKTFAVPAPDEQAIIKRVLELRGAGYSLDRIRQYLNYELKVTNREGHGFGSTEIRNIVVRGAEMLPTV
jgi:DNA invertase Pin-like site-specific DNA recombinase